MYAHKTVSMLTALTVWSYVPMDVPISSLVLQVLAMRLSEESTYPVSPTSTPTFATRTSMTMLGLPKSSHPAFHTTQQQQLYIHTIIMVSRMCIEPSIDTIKRSIWRQLFYRWGAILLNINIVPRLEEILCL